MTGGSLPTPEEVPRAWRLALLVPGAVALLLLVGWLLNDIRVAEPGAHPAHRRVANGQLLEPPSSTAGGAEADPAAGPSVTEGPPPADSPPAVAPSAHAGQNDQVEAPPTPPEVTVRGIYIPAGVTGLPERFAQLVQLVERTELNAVVIDVKDDAGYLVYESQVPVVREVDAHRPRFQDPEQVLRRLREAGIYTIARIVTFKDDVLATARPDWAIQFADGRTWRDRKGIGWANPYHPAVWDYNIAIAREAALLGFHEVQFDYVRFPTDGPVRDAVLPVQDQRSPEQVIAEFLRAADDALDPYGVAVSADVFGQVPSVRDDMGIGQRWEEVARGIDFISPMVYPSHYRSGVYGLPNPDAAPYETVLATLRDAVRRLPAENAAVIRPWLQDFSLRHRYGPDEVRAQIRAVYDAGLEQWLLWNASGRYTESALRPEDS